MGGDQVLEREREKEKERERGAKIDVKVKPCSKVPWKGLKRISGGGILRRIQHLHGGGGGVVVFLDESL